MRTKQAASIYPFASASFSSQIWLSCYYKRGGLCGLYLVWVNEVNLDVYII